MSSVEPSPHLPAAPVPCPARRRLLGATAALVVGAALLRPHPARAMVAGSRVDADTRTLSFVHTHTGEQVSLVYATLHAYVPDALAALAWFLRDFRNAAVHPIDPGLFDQLHTLATITGTRAPFQVISGYRSPATNRQLRTQGGGVAERSLHLEGRAIDGSCPGYTVDHVIPLKRGGADAPSNMQWQTNAAANEKDRWE